MVTKETVIIWIMLLGETLDNQVKAYVRSLREGGGPVTSSLLGEPYSQEV